jgi:DNA mismatch endonuclease (patch repair protein)
MSSQARPDVHRPTCVGVEQGCRSAAVRRALRMPYAYHNRQQRAPPSTGPAQHTIVTWVASAVRENGAVELPIPSSDGVSRRMARQARTGTAPELLLRRELHRRGLRYRVHVGLPVAGLSRRRADVLFGPTKVAVFVDGCFWHACPTHGTAPASNAGWWSRKLAANVARDRDTDSRLTEAGWLAVRIWEHEAPLKAADRVEEVVRRRRASTGVSDHSSSLSPWPSTD